MKPGEGNALVRVVAQSQFEGHDLAVIEDSRDGREWVTAPQASGVVGYSDPKQVADNVRRRWRNRLIDGVDYTMASGDDPRLALAKEAGIVERNASSVLLLSRSGLDIVIMLAKTPQGDAARRWLADVLFPSIRRTGTFGLSPRDELALKLGRYAMGTHYAGRTERLAVVARAMAARPELDNVKDIRRFTRLTKNSVCWALWRLYELEVVHVEWPDASNKEITSATVKLTAEDPQLLLDALDRRLLLIGGA